MTATSPTIIIKPNAQRNFADNIREIMGNLELLTGFARREIAVRYKQAAVGILWAVLQPLVTSAIFTFIFSYLAKVSSGDVPYPVFVYSGLLMWQYISRVVMEGSTSLVTNATLITKVYFPRLLIPLVVPLVAGVDFIIAVGVLLGMMLWFGMVPGPAILLLPVFLLMAGLLAYGVVLWVAPLNAIYRDVGIAMPILMQIVMYLSPVIYPVSLVPEHLRWLYELNPIATILIGTRWALIGGEPPTLLALGVYTVSMLFFLIIGFRVFRATEATLVDRI